MSCANSDSFTSFPIWVHFISFSSLIAVAKSSKTMLNNSGGSGQPCLVPDLWGNDFLFFFNDTATTEIYTLSLHDALPI